MRESFAKKIYIGLMGSILGILLFLPFTVIAQSDPAMTAEPPGTADSAEARCKALKDLLNIKYDNPKLEDSEKGVQNLASGLPDFCTIEDLLFKVINTLLTVSAIVAVLFIMLGGFWYLSSGGNEETSEKGKKILINAVIGLVVVIMAFTIVRILANTLTGGLGSDSPTETEGNIEDPDNNNSDDSVNAQSIVSAPLPSSVSAQGPFTVYATVRADKANQLAQVCGGSVDNCFITVEVDGTQRAQGVFSRNTSQFVATASVPGPFIPGDSLDVVVKVAGAEISSGSITVSSGGNPEI